MTCGVRAAQCNKSVLGLQRCSFSLPLLGMKLLVPLILSDQPGSLGEVEDLDDERYVTREDTPFEVEIWPDGGGPDFCVRKKEPSSPGS